MKNIIYFLVAVFVFSCEKNNNPDEKEWLQLFNGKDLKEWQAKITGHDLNDNIGNTFRVEEGILKVKYDQYDSFRQQFGHLFYKAKFSHYLLAVEYRFTGEQCKGGPDWAKRNSGAMLHCQDPSTMLKEQDFPISIEAQLLGGLGQGNRPTANLCTPGTNVHMGDTLFTPHCISSKSKTYDGDQWVHAEFLVLGDSLSAGLGLGAQSAYLRGDGLGLVKRCARIDRDLLMTLTLQVRSAVDAEGHGVRANLEVVEPDEAEDTKEAPAPKKSRGRKTKEAPAPESLPE